MHIAGEKAVTLFLHQSVLFPKLDKINYDVDLSFQNNLSLICAKKVNITDNHNGAVLLWRSFWEKLKTTIIVRLACVVSDIFQ